MLILDPSRAHTLGFPFIIASSLVEYYPTGLYLFSVSDRECASSPYSYPISLAIILTQWSTQ